MGPISYPTRRATIIPSLGIEISAPRSYWPFAGSSGNGGGGGRLIQVFLRSPSFRWNGVVAWPGNTRVSSGWKGGAGPPWDGITAYQHRAELNRVEGSPFSRATKNLVGGGGEEGGGGGREMDGDREWKMGKETTGVPLIGTHMSRDLISRYLRPYLAPCFIPFLTLCLPFTFDPRREGCDNVIERNADRIGWREWNPLTRFPAATAVDGNARKLTSAPPQPEERESLNRRRIF